MIDDLDGSSSTLRLLASEAIKKWSSSAILKLIFDDDYIVRTTAARELQLRGEKETFDIVVSLVSDERAFVREICAFILGQLGTPKMSYKEQSLPCLLNLIKDESVDVRAAAAAGLGHISYAGMSADAEDALLLAANDTEEGVRACAAYALGHASNSDKIKRALAELGSDSSEDVRSCAELGAELLSGR